MKHQWLCLVGALGVTGVVWADTPGFDRPGIAFDTGVLPPFSLAWEQGLPDAQRAQQQTLYSANSQLRIGLQEKVELQLAGSLYNYQENKSTAGTFSDEGMGDVGVGVKVALPSVDPAFSWAALLSAVLPTGEQAFTLDREQYALGVTTAFALEKEQAVALYYHVSHDSEETLFTFSPSWSVALNDQFAAYVEAGYTTGDSPDDNYLAGTGLTYALRPGWQLDVYGLWGLTEESSDWQAGFGLSAFFR